MTRLSVEALEHFLALPFEDDFSPVQRGGGKRNHCSTVDCGHNLQADVRSAHADLDVPMDFLIHAADTAEIWVGFSIWEKKIYCRIKRFRDITTALRARGAAVPLENLNIRLVLFALILKSHSTGCFLNCFTWFKINW